MPGERRQEKLSALLREEVARIVSRTIIFPEGALVTITRAQLSSDGYYATILLSVIQAEEKLILEILHEEIYTIQRELNRRLRMRPVPKIRFSIDKEEERREAVERSLNSLQ